MTREQKTQKDTKTNLEKTEILTSDFDKIKDKLGGIASSLTYVTSSMTAIEDTTGLEANPYLGLDEILINIKKDLDYLHNLMDIQIFKSL